MNTISFVLFRKPRSFKKGTYVKKFTNIAEAAKFYVEFIDYIVTIYGSRKQKLLMLRKASSVYTKSKSL